MNNLPNINATSLPNVNSGAQRNPNATSLNSEQLIHQVQTMGVEELHVRINGAADASVQMRISQQVSPQINRLLNLPQSSITLGNAQGALSFQNPAALLVALEAFNPLVSSQIQQEISSALSFQQSFFQSAQQPPSPLTDRAFGSFAQNNLDTGVRLFDILNRLSHAAELPQRANEPSADGASANQFRPQIRIQERMILEESDDDSQPQSDAESVEDQSIELPLEDLYQMVRGSAHSARRGVVVMDSTAGLGSNVLNLNRNSDNHQPQSSFDAMFLSGFLRSLRNRTPVVLPAHDQIEHRVAVNTPLAMRPFTQAQAICPITLNHVLSLEFPVELNGKYYELSELKRWIEQKYEDSNRIEDPMRNLYPNIQGLLSSLKALDFDVQLRNNALESLSAEASS